MTCRITQEALRNYVTHAERGRVVVFDTETTGISNDDEIVIPISPDDYIYEPVLE